MNSPESNLFELARICDNVDKLRNALDAYETGQPTLDENHNELPPMAECGADVSRLRDEDGRSILHHCVANRQSQVCFEFLLRRYPQLLLAGDYQGLTVMHLTVINGNVPLLRFLCGSGRKNISPNNFRLLLNAPDNELHSCLHWAVVCLEDTCLQLLLQAAAEQQNLTANDFSSMDQHVLAVRDVHGATPLHYAAQAGSRRMRSLSAASGEEPVDAVQTSVRRTSANIDTSGQDAFVSNTCSSQDVTKRLALRVLKRILQSKQVPVDCRDNEGRTPLLWAASSGENEALIELLNAAVNVNAQDKEGLTALHCAASKGHVDCIETLLNFGNADLIALDRLGASPLHYAATFGQLDATRLLISSGCSVDLVDFRGRTVVHCAAARGQYVICRTLAEDYDADLWKTNAKGELPLHDAVRNGRKDLVRWLLSLNPSAVNAANSFGRTCLHLAAMNANIELCKLLLDHGASINALMKQRGFIPEKMSQSQQLQSPSTNVNLSAGRKAACFGVSMVTPLDLALQRGNRNCARFLMLNGAFPAARLGLNCLLSKSNPALDHERLNSAFKVPSTMPTFDSATFAAGPTANFDWNVRRLSNRSSPLMKEAFLDDEAIRGMMSHSSQFNRTGRSQSHPTAAPMPHTRATTNTGSTCHPPPLHSQLQYNHQHLQNAQHHQHSQLLLPNLYSPHSPKSMLEYTAEEQQRAQSIVTNVYVNCGPTNGSHRSRRSMAAAAAIRKRRSSHMTASVSCHNLSHQHLVDVNQKQINGDDSDAVAIERMRAHSQNDRQSGKSNAQNRNARLTSSILHNELKDELNTNQTNQTERKCHDSMSSAESSNRSIARESVEQTMESELNVSAADHVDTATNNPTWMMAEASAVITNSRCSHRLHHKPPIDLTRSYVKPLKFEHVKPKVDTGPPTTYASKSPAPAKLNEPTSTRLPRSKSNLEFVDLDELDEKGDLVQTAQKSVRKYQIERKLFQELQDLKRYQSRGNQVNEAVFIKRLANNFNRNYKHPKMADFCGPYTYKLYEKYLYDQLRKLSISNEDKVLPLLKELPDEQTKSKASAENRPPPSMIPKRIQGKSVVSIGGPSPAIVPKSQAAPSRPSKLPTPQYAMHSKTRRLSDNDQQQTHSIAKATPESIDAADETLQDISSSLSEAMSIENIGRLEIEQRMVRDLVAAEMNSLQKELNVGQQAEVKQIMNEILQVDRLSDKIEDSINVESVKQPVDEAETNRLDDKDEGEKTKKMRESENQDEKQDDDYNEEDADEDEEEIQEITAKLIEIKEKKSESDQNDDSQVVGNALNIQQAKESPTMISLTEKKEEEQDRNEEKEMKEKLEYVEPEITIERPPFHRQVSTMVRDKAIDNMNGEPGAQTLTGARKESVVRFADTVDNQLEQMRKIYNKTPIKQSSMERTQSLAKMPSFDSPNQVQTDKISKTELTKSADDPGTDAVKESQLPIETTAEEDEMTIEEYPDEDGEEEEDNAEEKAKKEDKDSGSEQARLVEEEAARRQVKQEKLELIESIERQIRENLEQERAMETASRGQAALQSIDGTEGESRTTRLSGDGAIDEKPLEPNEKTKDEKQLQPAEPSDSTQQPESKPTRNVVSSESIERQQNDANEKDADSAPKLVDVDDRAPPQIKVIKVNSTQSKHEHKHVHSHMHDRSDDSTRSQHHRSSSNATQSMHHQHHHHQSTAKHEQYRSLHPPTRRVCLKAQATASEPPQQTSKGKTTTSSSSTSSRRLDPIRLSRPKYEVHVDQNEIHRRWEQTKRERKAELRMRRSQSNPMLPSSIELLYELKPSAPRWARPETDDAASMQAEPDANVSSKTTIRVFEQECRERTRFVSPIPKTEEDSVSSSRFRPWQSTGGELHVIESESRSSSRMSEWQTTSKEERFERVRQSEKMTLKREEGVRSKNGLDASESHAGQSALKKTREPHLQSTRFTSECRISSDGRSLICVNECHRIEQNGDLPEANGHTTPAFTGASHSNLNDERFRFESDSNGSGRWRSVWMESECRDRQCAGQCAHCHKFIVPIRSPESEQV